MRNLDSLEDSCNMDTILRKACYEYFDLELPDDDENSEVVADSNSSDGSDDTAGGSDESYGESDGEE